jgi:two-component system response regulator NreC
MNMPLSVRLLLVDEHPLTQQRLRILVEAHHGWQVVGVATNGYEAAKLAAAHRPDVAIIDMRTPVLTGVMTTRRILAQSPSTKVIILSRHSEEAYVTHTRKAGAAGFVLAGSADVDLSQAVSEVSQGGFFLSPALRDSSSERWPCDGDPADR